MVNSLPKISIIVPVYRVEKYLSQCIESIITQTYTNFELLLIDDGSPDLSGKICDEYAEKDRRVRVYHKTNSGVSDTRNVGLKKARGEWILFVDSDDWLSSQCLETCSNAMADSQLDLLQFGYQRVCDDGQVLFSSKEHTEKLFIPDYIKEKKMLVTPWGNIFKRSIIAEYNIRFNPKIKLGEDQLFVFEYIVHCEFCQRIPNSLYFYRWNVNSASRNPKSEDCINSIVAFQNFRYRSLVEEYIQKGIFMFLFSTLKERKISLSQVYSLVRTETFVSVEPQRKLQKYFLLLWKLNKWMALFFLYYTANIGE